MTPARLAAGVLACGQVIVGQTAAEPVSLVNLTHY
jgi:hypothetical protein